MTTFRFFLLVFFWSGLTGQLMAFPQEKVDFNRDIRPILSDRCFKCHGPDENSRATDLRLDTRAEAVEALEGDSPEEVELLIRIFSDDEDEVMPPPDSKLSLSDREKSLLKSWIKSGAPYARHWAFEKPVKSKLPSVKNGSWAKNEIDLFVLSKLEENGFQPNPPASRERLIRRITFDLTGLPPTLAEIDQFLNDKNPGAIERLVDRLLKKASFGERMTSEWLDVARYSDSFGYQVDRPRHVWPWRDWVISSFNNNMPYNQFVLEQLAGDMLPNATDEQILATAFNRLHPQKVEGGSVPEEFRVEYVADRTHTFGTAFLGLTLECARCHDHKYDPISQSEYYSLFAYFNNIDEAGLYSYFTNSTPTPTLLLTNDDRKKQIAELERQIMNKANEIAEYHPKLEDWKAWVQANAGAESSSLFPKAIETLSFEDFKSGRNQSVKGAVGRGVQLTGDDAIGLKTGNFSRNQPFSISLWINTPDVKERAVILHRSRAWTDAGSRGYQMLLEDGKLSVSLIHFWPGNAIRVRTTKPLETQKWIHVGFSYDGSSRAKGIKLFVNGRPAATEIVRDNLYKNITGGGGDKIAIGQRFRDNGFKNGSVDEVNVFDTEITGLHFSDLYDQVKNPAKEKRTAAIATLDENQQKKWMQLFSRHHDLRIQTLQKEIRDLRDQRSKLVDSTVEIMVMKEMKNRRKTYRLQRGAYDKPADSVDPRIPSALVEPKSDIDKTSRRLMPKSRLELAKWIISNENPLTARVTVNRYWQLIFGEGLVRTPEDFGSQGTPPTHPQLLDWLAKDFMEHNWNLKRLIKMMVLSSTYQQDSSLRPEVYKTDPGNELLSRAFSFRMPAEMLRDNALSTAGILVHKIGGSGAKPYDLALSFKPVGVDKGEGLYRRSVYTYWKRTGPSPVMMTLDASKRDVCTVKRERTATPLQSFVLMNDPQFVEASRAMAAQTLTQKESNTSDIIGLVFRKLTSRQATKRELDILQKLYESQSEYFKTNSTAMKKYLEVGNRRINADVDAVSVASLTAVIQTIMNFDECVMRK